MDKNSRGILYTFYSFKGGAGRSMALANSAALLARWGHSVLVVDWDLEAPGLEKYFAGENKEAVRIVGSRPGIVDLILAKAKGAPLPWRDATHSFEGNGGLPITFISAGKRDGQYIQRLQEVNFSQLFLENDMGAYIEELRTEWTKDFEFVLIDSRTGVTDIGGICTAHFADVLVLMFTANHSSLEGAIDIARRADLARQTLPLDRGKLLVLPVPSRDESRTEYERALDWRKIFARELDVYYRDWLPEGVSVEQAVDTIRIPYVPYWSFGERLCVVDERPAPPGSLSYAYELLARLLASRLEWSAAIADALLRPSARVEKRSLPRAWRDSMRTEARGAAAPNSYMEILHYCIDSPINKLQDELLAAARESQISTLGWPLGIVLDRTDARPRAKASGIVAEIVSDGGESPARKKFDYWALSKKGDFFALSSLFEDTRGTAKLLFLEYRVYRTAEALLHCAKLYRRLGADLKSSIAFTIRYKGLVSRTLTSSGRINTYLQVSTPTSFEDICYVALDFQLDKLESDLETLVERLCTPLFLLFDFVKLSPEIYKQLVKEFTTGRIQ